MDSFRTSDDYYNHVRKMERMTSTLDGPHFPSLTRMFKTKEVEKVKQLEEKEKENKEKERREFKTRAGLFGRAEHQFDTQPVQTVTRKDDIGDVNAVANEFIRDKHATFVTV